MKKRRTTKREQAFDVRVIKDSKGRFHFAYAHRWSESKTTWVNASDRDEIALRKQLDGGARYQ